MRRGEFSTSTYGIRNNDDDDEEEEEEQQQMAIPYNRASGVKWSFHRGTVKKEQREKVPDLATGQDGENLTKEKKKEKRLTP